MLLDALLKIAEDRAERPAVADPFVRWDYGRLRLAAATMRDLIASGTRAEHVGLLLPSTGAFVAAFFGCHWARRVPVPLNFLLTPRELRQIVADAGLDLVLSVTALREQAEGCGARVLYLDELNLRARAVWRRVRGLPPAPQLRADDTAVLLYTSGTSGEPKGACLTHGNLLADSRACLEHARIDPNQRFLGILPLFHSFGLTGTMLLPLTVGASVYYVPRFAPAQAARAIAQEQITILMAIPSMYAAIARLKEARPEDFTSLYLAISGGEPLPRAVYDLARQSLGLTIHEGYGLTETSPVISINMPWKHRVGSVGTALPGVELRIADDAGADVPRGTVGDILVRGPIVMKEYYRKPEATRAVLDGAGWLWTGDVGTLDAEGFLTITGRKKDIIIIGGENVFPGEIERVLESHPGVAQAAVIGVGDAARGEVPIAYVLPREGAQVSEIELRTWCRQCLAGYKVPRQIHLAADLPRGPTGKILKRKLREAVAQDAADPPQPGES